MRSRAGLRAVAVTLAILAVTALVQAAIYIATGSIALLADLIHNAGDALTAVPLGAAFLLRSERAERRAGLAVVLTIFASAVTAGVFAVERTIHPLPPQHLQHRLEIAVRRCLVGGLVPVAPRGHDGHRLEQHRGEVDGEQLDLLVHVMGGHLVHPPEEGQRGVEHAERLFGAGDARVGLVTLLPFVVGEDGLEALPVRKRAQGGVGRHEVVQMRRPARGSRDGA